MNWGARSRLQKSWDIRAACNFIGGGTGSSILLWAAIGQAAGHPYYPAALTGLIFVGAGLFMVWLEIGKPWRALNVFFRPQTSWMAREGIASLPLFASGLLAALLDMEVIPSAPVSSLTILAALAAAFGMVFLYCQLRILGAARGLPLWREPRAMPLLGLSGLAEGLGIYLLVLALLGITSMPMALTIVFLIAARLLVWRSYLAALARSDTPEQTMIALLKLRRSFLLVGHILPLVFISSALAFPRMALPLSALAGVSAALGGWMLKRALITRAAYIQKHTVPLLPIRGRLGPIDEKHNTNLRRPI